MCARATLGSTQEIIVQWHSHSGWLHIRQKASSYLFSAPQPRQNRFMPTSEFCFVCAFEGIWLFRFSSRSRFCFPFAFEGMLRFLSSSRFRCRMYSSCAPHSALSFFASSWFRITHSSFGRRLIRNARLHGIFATILSLSIRGMYRYTVLTLTRESLADSEYVKGFPAPSSATSIFASALSLFECDDFIGCSICFICFRVTATIFTLIYLLFSQQ